jgi:acyl carrier protein
MEAIKHFLREFIAENILFTSKGYPHADEMSFLENGIIDSMSVMDLVLQVEERYQIKISDHELTPENFDSVENLANYITHKIDQTEGSNSPVR